MGRKLPSTKYAPPFAKWNLAAFGSLQVWFPVDGVQVTLEKFRLGSSVHWYFATLERPKYRREMWSCANRSFADGMRVYWWKLVPLGKRWQHIIEDLQDVGKLLPGRMRKDA